VDLSDPIVMEAGGLIAFSLFLWKIASAYAKQKAKVDEMAETLKLVHAEKEKQDHHIGRINHALDKLTVIVTRQQVEVEHLRDSGVEQREEHKELRKIIEDMRAG